MSVNKVILLGNIGRDPEIRYLDGGVCNARFSVATSDRAYTTASGVQVPERTEWHNVVAWRGLAQVIERYVTKGTRVYVEGKLQTRQWDDASGQKRYTTEILAENFEILSGKKDQPQGAPAPSVNDIPPASRQQPQPSVEQSQGQVGNEGAPFATDDLPF